MCLMCIDHNRCETFFHLSFSLVSFYAILAESLVDSLRQMLHYIAGSLFSLLGFEMIVTKQPISWHLQL